MNRFRAHFLILTVFSISILATSNCGGSNRQLQSIAIQNGGSMTQLQLTATGMFNQAPATATPLPVGWYVTGPGILFAPPPGTYVLSSQPFGTACATGNAAVAIAPTDPHAPSTGPIPVQVFEDLVVTQKTSSEGGFVAAVQAISCP